MNPPDMARRPIVRQNATQDELDARETPLIEAAATWWRGRNGSPCRRASSGIVISLIPSWALVPPRTSTA